MGATASTVYRLYRLHTGVLLLAFPLPFTHVTSHSLSHTRHSVLTAHSFTGRTHALLRQSIVTPL